MFTEINSYFLHLSSRREYGSLQLFPWGLNNIHDCFFFQSMNIKNLIGLIFNMKIFFFILICLPFHLRISHSNKRRLFMWFEHTAMMLFIYSWLNQFIFGISIQWSVSSSICVKSFLKRLFLYSLFVWNYNSTHSTFQEKKYLFHFWNINCSASFWWYTSKDGFRWARGQIKKTMAHIN